MILVGVVPSGIVEQTRLLINQTYLDGVFRAGGLPVLFPLTADQNELRSLMNRVDGLLLTGGEDVDPALYGEEKLPAAGNVHPSGMRWNFPSALWPWNSGSLCWQSAGASSC